MTCAHGGLLVLLSVACCVPVASQQPRSPEPKLCNEIVTTAYPEWHAYLPRQNQRRVEVRNCQLEDWGVLQIAAWRNGASEPSLIVETYRTTIVKIATAGNVFVLETAGGSSNLVQVVVYEDGVPRLALSEAIRAYARVEMSWKKVVVGLPQGKAPERVYEFPTGMN